MAVKLHVQEVPEGPEETWEEQVQLWVQHAVGGGVSRKTVREYRGPVLRHLVPFLYAEGIHPRLAVGQDTLDRLTTKLLHEPKRDGTPRSRYTVDSYVTSFNLFLGWRADRFNLSLHNAQHPKLQVLEPEVVEVDQYEKLLGVAADDRDRLVLRCLWELGVRVDELVTMDFTSPRMRDRSPMVFVEGKTGQRWVPVVSRALFSELDRLARVRSNQYERHSGPRELFLAKRRRPGGVIEPLTTSGVRQLLADLSEAAGMPRISPQMFRRSFATRWADKGFAIDDLALVMGTSAPVLARFYRKVRARKLFERMARAGRDSY